MKPDGVRLEGSAFNPDDGQTYTGKMSLSGATLTTQGCAMGGMICKSRAGRGRTEKFRLIEKRRAHKGAPIFVSRAACAYAPADCVCA